MKKVLIITNLFYNSPRIPGLVKYLPEFNFEPTILTTIFRKKLKTNLGSRKILEKIKITKLPENLYGCNLSKFGYNY